MPRKRKPSGAPADAPVQEARSDDVGTIVAAAEAVEEAGGATVASPDAGQATSPATEPATSAEPPQTPATDPTATTLVDPYRPLFTCSPKGFEMGENRRFKQRVFRFKDKPEPAVLERLKAAGYTYRASEKAWTVAATPQSRLESEALAQTFAGNTALERADGGVQR